MGKANLEMKELSLVLVGKYNPIIFHPQWLSRKDLIRQGEADEANVKINHPEVSEFDLEYCRIQVIQDRFSATSAQETHFKAMRDLVYGIFQQLPECPIKQLGINLNYHYKFENESDFIDFGHKVVPKDQLWNNLLSNAGLLTVSLQGDRTDDFDGKKRVTVTRSKKVKLGVEVSVNDHFELWPQSKPEDMDARRAVSRLNTDLEKSISDSSVIIEGIFDYGTT